MHVKTIWILALASVGFVSQTFSTATAKSNHVVDYPKTIISAEQLKNITDTNNNGVRYVIAEVSWGGPETGYIKGHIPNAIHVNTDEIEYDQFKKRAGLKITEKLGRSTSVAEDKAKGLSENDTLPRNWWNIYPDEYLLPALANMGIDRHTDVIVYGKDMTAAARFTWTLLYAGVENVKLLNGGLKAWREAGYEVSRKVVKRKPLAGFGANRALRPGLLAVDSYVRDVVNGKISGAVIADIRTKKEYDGLSAPYSYIPTKGRIKGALWGQAGDGPWTMDAYVGSDGKLKNLQDIEAMWKQAGITRDKEVSFYCGTAWRSSLAFFVAYSLGWDKIKNFDSSWYRWSMGPEAAINPMINFAKK